jgi:antitoxin Phd
VSLTAHDVEASLSELLETTLKEGPQIVTRGGVERAVLIPIDEWKRLQASVQPLLVDPLLDPNGPHDIYIPSRGKLHRRAPIEFD